MADFERDIDYDDSLDRMPPSFPPSQHRDDAVRARVTATDSTSGSEKSPAAQGGDGSSSGADELNQLSENADYPQRSKLKSFFVNTFEFVALLAVALVAAVLLKTFIVQPFEIPSSSMADTLLPNDRILVNKMADTEDELERGDIVVFVDPGEWLADVQPPEISGLKKVLVRAGEMVGLLPQDAGTHLVKRLIGKPGDHIVCCTVDGNLTINGTEVREPYLIDGASASEMPFEVTVPAGHLWMMGDNRPGSKDSRYHQAVTGFGFVPIENVEGRAWLRVYPFNRFATLPSQQSVFADVPDPKPAK